MSKLKYELDTQDSNFNSELKMVLDYYIEKDYNIEGKFGDKTIEILVDEKVLLKLEHLSGVNPKYGIRFVGKSDENFLMGLLNVPCVVDVLWR